MRKEILTKELQSAVKGGCGGGVPMFNTPSAYFSALAEGIVFIGDGSFNHSLKHWFRLPH